MRLVTTSFGRSSIRWCNGKQDLAELNRKAIHKT